MLVAINVSGIPNNDLSSNAWNRIPRQSGNPMPRPAARTRWRIPRDATVV